MGLDVGKLIRFLEQMEADPDASRIFLTRVRDAMTGGPRQVTVDAATRGLDAYLAFADDPAVAADLAEAARPDATAEQKRILSESLALQDKASAMVSQVIFLDEPYREWVRELLSKHLGDPPTEHGADDGPPSLEPG